jgi:hypothetical protein
MSKDLSGAIQAAARSHEPTDIMLKTIKASGVLRQDFVLQHRRGLRVVA